MRTKNARFIKFSEVEAGLKMYGFSSAKTIASRHGYPILDTIEYMKLMLDRGYVRHARGQRNKDLYGARGYEGDVRSAGGEE